MALWFRLTSIVLTVGGGFAGIVGICQAVSARGVRHVGDLLLLLVFFALYAFVLAAGLVFAGYPRRTTLLVIAFSLQVPSFSSPVLGYCFGAGVSVTIGTLAGNPQCTFRLGSDFSGSVLQGHPWGAGLNIVALGALATLLWHRRVPVAKDGAAETNLRS
jgi:hypothetical protein